MCLAILKGKYSWHICNQPSTSVLLKRLQFVIAVADYDFRIVEMKLEFQLNDKANRDQANFETVMQDGGIFLIKECRDF